MAAVWTAALAALLHAALAAGFAVVPLSPRHHLSTRVAATAKGREPEQWQRGEGEAWSRSPRQGQGQHKRREQLQHPEGSWRCPSCHNMNWPQRVLCNRCGGPQDVEVGQPEASTAGLVADVMAAARRGNGKKAAELLAALPSAMANGQGNGQTSGVPTPTQRSELRSIRNKVLTALSQKSGKDMSGLVLQLFEEEDEVLWGRRTAYTWSAAFQACASSPKERWRDALRLLDNMGAADDDADADDDGVDVAAVLAAKKGKGEAGGGEAEQEVGNAVALFGPVRVRANEFHIGLAMKTLLGAGKTKEVRFELGPGFGQGWVKEKLNLLFITLTLTLTLALTLASP